MPVQKNNAFGRERTPLSANRRSVVMFFNRFLPLWQSYLHTSFGNTISYLFTALNTFQKVLLSVFFTHLAVFSQTYARTPTAVLICCEDQHEQLKSLLSGKQQLKRNGKNYKLEWCHFWKKETEQFSLSHVIKKTHQILHNDKTNNAVLLLYRYSSWPRLHFDISLLLGAL